MKVQRSSTLALLPVLVALLTSVRADAADVCQVDGSYHVISKAKLGGQRIVGLVTRRLPNDAPVLDVLADAGSGEQTIASGALAEGASGRWRVDEPVSPPDGPGLRLQLKRCERFAGRIKAPGKASRRLVAVRTTCGDGHVDRFANEDCEPGGAACTAGTCTDRCVCQGSGGLPDATFGTDGVATIQGGPLQLLCPARLRCPSGVVGSVLPQADGKIVVLGSVPDLYGNVHLLDRLRADGTLDPDFQEIALGGANGPRVNVTADGHVTWAQGNPPTEQFAMRFSSDGIRDQSFGDGLGRTERVDDAAATADGGIVAIGNGTVTTWTAVGTVQLIDLPDGWTPAAVDDDARILALRSDGTLLLGRFLAAGTPDPTFGGGDGVCIAATVPNTQPNVVPLGDGSVLVGVRTDDGFRITRVAPNGDGLDADCQPEPASFTAAAMPEVVQFDGKYLAPVTDGLIRLLPDGTLDLDFGRLGTLAIPAVTALALDAEGRILVGSESGTRDRVVRRFLP